MIAAIVIVSLLTGLACIALWVRHAYPFKNNEIVEAIDALLPQTQCAQCGYPGCQPYAQALADGRAAPNLCPPGGDTLVTEIVDLLNLEIPAEGPEAAPAQVALIDETACIGCALCLPPCPVDAIIGANGYTHTVVADACTGCELCIPACPVDCISLQELPTDSGASAPRTSAAERTSARGCIHCGQCDAVCPVDLPARALFNAISNQAEQKVSELGIDQCVECGLCDKVCPSEIPLVSYFSQIKEDRSKQDERDAYRDALKARYTRHEERLATQIAASQSQRAERLKRGRSWQ